MKLLTSGKVPHEVTTKLLKRNRSVKRKTVPSPLLLQSINSFWNLIMKEFIYKFSDTLVVSVMSKSITEFLSDPIKFQIIRMKRTQRFLKLAIQYQRNSIVLWVNVTILQILSEIWRIIMIVHIFSYWNLLAVSVITSITTNFLSNFI